MQIYFVWIGGLVVGSLEAETGCRSWLSASRFQPFLKLYLWRTGDLSYSVTGVWAVYGERFLTRELELVDFDLYVLGCGSFIWVLDIQNANFCLADMLWLRGFRKRSVISSSKRSWGRGLENIHRA